MRVETHGTSARKRFAWGEIPWPSRRVQRLPSTGAPSFIHEQFFAGNFCSQCRLLLSEDPNATEAVRKGINMDQWQLWKTSEREKLDRDLALIVTDAPKAAAAEFAGGEHPKGTEHKGQLSLYKHACRYID